MIETAYIAGIFDGEGWITISKWENAQRKRTEYAPNYVRLQLIVGIANSHLPLMENIHAQLGGNLFQNDSAFRKNPKNRICYHWRVSSGKAADFLKQILPHLIAKRDEAILAIELQQHITENIGVLKYHPERSQELYSFRQNLTDQIKLLKKRRFAPLVNGDAQITKIVQ